jgi:DNA-binding YbaB/EbfC family protein
MDLNDLFKQAKEAQAKAGAMQEKIAKIEVEGQSGGGMVKLILSGKSELRKLVIDPTLLKPEDREMVEDLIVAAHGDAKMKLEQRIAGEMQKLAQEMGLPPGMGLPSGFGG